MFRKKIVLTTMMTAVFSLIMLFVFQLPVYARQEVILQVKGEAVTGSAPVFVKNRIMIPVRDLADCLNVDINWNSEKREVTVTHPEGQMSLVVGKKQAIVDGKSVLLNVAPAIVENKVLVPLRFIAEFCGYSVSWDKAAKVVSLDKQALVAGCSLDFPPFEFRQGNEIVSFEMDIIRIIKESIGEDIVIKDISFDRLIPSLLSGEIDMIVSGLSITEPRKEVIDFSIPIYDEITVILSSKDIGTDLELEDLAEKHIAVQANTYYWELVRNLQEKYPDTQITTYDSMEQVLDAAEKGNADAIVAPHYTVAYYLTNHKDSNLKIIGQLDSGQPFGIAVRKGDQELLDKLNKSLETIIENGTYDRIYEKWFGKEI